MADQDPNVAAHERVEHDFTLHPPVSPETGAEMDAIRSAFKELAHAVVERCPSTRERSSALTRLEEAMFHAIASLARNQPRPQIGDTKT